MKVLLDAGVPKDSLMVAAFHVKLRKLGHQIFVTAREYESTTTLLEYFDIEYISVGRYGGKTLKGKLMADLERAIKLTEVFSEIGDLDVVIHFANPATARVSFGLGIPQIILEDTPHAQIVHRLTFPLATYVITPKCLPRELLQHMIAPDRLIQYDGVDPLEWVSTFPPDSLFLNKLNLEISRPIVILRPAETYAYYYLDYSRGEPLLFETRLIETILRFYPDTQILVFPRYSDQREILARKFGDKIKMPRRFIPAYNVVAFSTLLITGGGTMVEEGALYGVPSIYFFPKKLGYAEYLREKGLPVFHIVEPQRIIEFVLRVLKDPDNYRIDPQPIIKKMEKPSDKLIPLLEKLQENS